MIEAIFSRSSSLQTHRTNNNNAGPDVANHTMVVALETATKPSAINATNFNILWFIEFGFGAAALPSQCCS